MKKIARFISLIFVLSLLVFVVQNLQDVDLHFAIWDWKMTLAAPVVAAYVLGSFTGRGIWRLLNSQRRQRKVERKARHDAEVALKEKQRQQASSNAG